MERLPRFSTTIITGALLCAMTACSASTGNLSANLNSSGPVSRAVEAPTVAHHGARALLYVTNGDDNSANVYAQAGHDQSPLLTLPGQHPTAVADDEQGNVYVASTDTHSISVFPPGKTVANKTLTDTLAYPLSLAVGHDQTTYAGNLLDFNYNPVMGDVVEYGPGATKPTRTIRNSNYARIVSVALDAKGNVYVGYDKPGSGVGVDVYPPHGTAGRSLNLQLSTIACLAIDGDGAILVSQGTLGNIEVFAHGSKQPTRTLSGFQVPTGIAFNDAKTHLYVAESENNYTGTVREIDYTTGQTLDVISKPNVAGFCGVAATL